MVRVVRHVRVRRLPLARVGGGSVWLPGRSIAVLALALLVAAAVDGSARGQARSGCNNGCNEGVFRLGPFTFPNPFANPSAAQAPAERVRRGSERRGDTRRRVASAGREREAAFGGSVPVCVRTCDGGFFPLPYSAASGAALEEACRALCPNAEVVLYTMPFGETIDQAVSWTGALYTAEPNAFKFQQAFETSCSCRRPGQSWADALAAAEAKYGRRSHEVVVTAEASEAMARPKPDGNAKSAAAKSKIGQSLGAVDSLEPALDFNGVDTHLEAAAAAVSRETSGIKDEESNDRPRFGLHEGQVVDEDDPDGGRRRVRIVAPMF
jgi:hypothetical protein